MIDVTQQPSFNGYGRRLKTAREALKLSQKDAAVRLHLSPQVLASLEDEDFTSAPPVTFLRGYLRSYARLLNFSEAEVNTILDESGLNTKPSAPIIPILHSENIQMGDRYVQWVSTAVVLGLFIFVGIWWGFHSHSATTNNTLTAPTATAQPTQTQPSAPNTVQPVNDATTPTQAATTTPDLSNTQPITILPTVDTSSSLISTTAAVTAVTTTLKPILPSPASKKHNHKHNLDNDVSGVSMALPEPGL